MKVFKEWRFLSFSVFPISLWPPGVRLVFLHEELADSLRHDHTVTKDVIGPC